MPEDALDASWILPCAILLGRALAAQGRYAESVESCLEARELMVDASYLPYLLGTLGYAYASRGDSAAARGVGDELRRRAKSAVTAHERAVVSTALGEWDEALGALGAAFEHAAVG